MGNDNNAIDPVAVDQIIEEAIGKAIDQFKYEHPATYKAITRRIENPVELVMESLKQGPYYQQLMAATDEAVDLARIIVGIVEAAFMVVEKFLPLI